MTRKSFCRNGLQPRQVIAKSARRTIETVCQRLSSHCKATIERFFRGGKLCLPLPPPPPQPPAPVILPQSSHGWVRPRGLELEPPAIPLERSTSIDLETLELAIYDAEFELDSMGEILVDSVAHECEENINPVAALASADVDRYQRSLTVNLNAPDTTAHEDVVTMRTRNESRGRLLGAYEARLARASEMFEDDGARVADAFDRIWVVYRTYLVHDGTRFENSRHTTLLRRAADAIVQLTRLLSDFGSASITSHDWALYSHTLKLRAERRARCLDFVARSYEAQVVR